MVFKGALRAVKNVTNGYSDAEAKVRAVTSNENVIPSGAQMHELAQLSYNQCVPYPRGPRAHSYCYHSEDFADIVGMLDKRLNDKGKYWRHIYKVRAITIVSVIITPITDLASFTVPHRRRIPLTQRLAQSRTVFS